MCCPRYRASASWRDFFLYEDVFSYLLNAPALDRVDRRSPQSFARAQAETRMMPRASHFVVDDQTFAERAVVVRAVRAHCKEFSTAPDQQDLLFTHHSQKISTIRDARKRDSILQVMLLRTHVAGLTYRVKAFYLRFARLIRNRF